MPDLQLTFLHKNPVAAGHIGTVSDVIAGRIQEDLRHRRYKASDFQYGFELASPESISSIGEAVIANGYCYTNSTEQQSPQYYQTITGQDFVTSGVFLLPNNVRPNYVIEEDFSPPLKLNLFYGQLFKEIGQPFAFAGFFTFAELSMTAIAKPPITEENIFTNSKSYYPFASRLTQNEPAFLVGVVADYKNKNHEKVLKSLEVVLYNNPYDKQDSLTAHAHGITLKQAINEVKDINPDVVDKTVHVFAERSTIQRIKAELFVIGSMVNFS